MITRNAPQGAYKVK